MSIREELQKLFSKEDIKYRAASSGISNGRPWVKVLSYIDARHVENRLDEVFGWENWESDYKSIEFIDNKGIKKTGFICTIEVNYNDKKIKKSNGADLTDYESFKGGISDSFKRAAAHGFGIGRELYETKEIFADIQKEKTSYYTEMVKICTDKKNKAYEKYYWALPGVKKQPTQGRQQKDGKPVTIEDTDKLVTEKQLKRLFAIQKKTFLSEEDVKVDIKERYNYDSRKDFRKSKYDEYCAYLESLINEDDFEELSNKLVENYKKVSDLKPFFEKWGVKDINRLNKEQCKDLIKRLNNLKEVKNKMAFQNIIAEL